MSYYSKAEIRQLIAEALTYDELEKLCHDWFPSVYANFDGKSRSQRDLDLADYVFRQSKADYLFDHIEAINPERYNEIINPLISFQVYNFDLTHSIEDCLDKIYGKRGLISLSLSCSNNYLFIDSFCKRLNMALSKQTYVIENPPAIVSNKANSIIRIGEKIGSNKKLTGDNIGIFPIDINSCNRTEDINKFLNFIQKSFENKLDFCSIVIMFRKGDFIYPSNVISLDSPKFKESDLSKWINELTKALIGKHRKKEWEEEWKRTGKSWLAKAIEKLRSEEDNALDVDPLYAHLSAMLDELKPIPRISPQEFLTKVEKDLKYLTEKD